jgi:hypothetical protein
MNAFFTIGLLVLAAVLGQAYPTYTGYSGAVGSKGTCASSCHGSGTGTITVTGFPQTYIPGASYAITVKRVGGSLISNFNCSSRKGTTTQAGGTFTAGTKSALYSVSGYETGVRGSVNSIDSANFMWTAPAAGSGSVLLSLSGLQGSKSGQTTKISLTAVENVTGIVLSAGRPKGFSLAQNFPNPFNPSTTIEYSVGDSPSRLGEKVTLKVYDLLGKEVAVLADGRNAAGTYRIRFFASTLPGGIYFYTLRSGSSVQTRRMVVLK